MKVIKNFTVFFKVPFLIQNAWKSIIYNKYASIILLVALTLGIGFPMLALNDVNDLLKDGYVSKYEDPSAMAVLEYSMRYKTEEEMYAAIWQGKEDGLFAEAGFCAYQAEIIYVGETSYWGGVSGVSKEYLTLSSNELVKGELFSGEEYAGDGEKVCLLAYGSRLVQNGVGIGDEIEILGNRYRVKGIIRAPRSYGGVLLPYAVASECFSATNGLMQYQVITYGENKVPAESMARRLFPSEGGVGGILSAQTGVRQEELYYQSIREVNRYRILRAVVVMVFAVVNILLLFMGMMLRRRYAMAVRMALGADRKVLLLEMLIRNLFFTLAAFFLAILLYPFVSMLTRNSIKLQLITVLQTGVGACLIIAFLSSMLFYTVLQKGEAALLLKK